MDKFIKWFKKYIFEASYSDQDCYAIHLFTIFIDFRCWYKYDDLEGDDGCYYFEEEILAHIKEVEKKNVRRKNKIPVPTYSRIPWYVTITNWRTLIVRTRSLRYLVIGLLLGSMF
jgi:hypothetical protein